jgi:hypothetical protein
VCAVDKFVGTISQKKPIGKQKVILKGEGTQKLDAQLPYKWGYDESLYTICGCILKAAKKHVLD